MTNRRKQKRRSRRSTDPSQKLTWQQSGPRGIADRLLLESADKILPGDCLLILLNGTASAKHLIQKRPDVRWDLFTFEHFYLQSVLDALSPESESPIDPDTHVELFCMPDLPDKQYSTIVLPTDFRSSSEMARDLLQQIGNRLKPNGRLVISTNNPKDHWLGAHLKKAFGKTTVIPHDRGICYVARANETQVKQKSFDAEFAFRDNETLIPCASRPGVFSHRRIDPGARALIKSLGSLPRPPKRIVELGCGSGAVSVAAALRFPEATVLAVDSHVRAVQATERTAALNSVENLQVLLTSDGEVPDPGSYDLFLGNPPYYSDYRISEVFLQAAESALRIGGRAHVVTKLKEWHHNRMIEIFADGDSEPIGDYHVIKSVKRYVG